MYDPISSTPVVDSGTAGALMAFLAGFWVLTMIFAIFFIFCMWKMFVKAGKPGWAAIVPVYNAIVLMEIIGRPTWWFAYIFLPMIPVIGWIAAVVVGVIIAIDLAKAFGKDTGFGILLAFLPIVGYPMLAFGDAQYVGKSAPVASVPPAPTPTTTVQ